MATGNKNYILTYGIIGGVISILYTIVLYIVGPESFTGPLGWSGILVGLIAPVLGAKAQKKADDGFLEFQDALKTFFGIMVVGAIISMIFQYVLFNLFDPAFKESLTQVGAEQAAKMAKRFGASDDDAEKAMQQALSRDPYSLSSMAINFAVACIFSFLLSLIGAAILKKKRPEFNA